MINSTITDYNFRAIMSDLVKPSMTVLAIIKVPDWVGYFFSIFTTESISETAVFISQVGGAFYILFKIYDWIYDKINKKIGDETK